MTSEIEISARMDQLEEEAQRILLDPNLAPLDRKSALNRLLGEYRVLEQYKAALAAFVRRMMHYKSRLAGKPEQAMQEILASSEYVDLRPAVIAALITVTYSGGPRSEWVPQASLAPTPGLRM